MARIPINTSTPNDGLGDPLRTAMTSINTMFTELYANVVFKVAGKDLSSNDYNDAAVTKLAGIEAGAEVNIQADLLQEDDTQDDFVKGKNSIYVPTQFTFRFTPVGQICTLPTGAIATSATIDGYPQYLEQAGFETDLNTFTQTLDEVTFKTTFEGTPQILITYYL